MEPWTASLLVKKGAFSCLIALFTYSIFYSILQIGIIEELNTFKIQDIFDFISGNKKKVIDFINNCGTALPIVIGFVNLSLSFALKSPMISVMNLLIYIGMTIYYCRRRYMNKVGYFYDESGMQDEGTRVVYIR